VAIALGGALWRGRFDGITSHDYEIREGPPQIDCTISLETSLILINDKTLFKKHNWRRLIRHRCPLLFPWSRLSQRSKGRRAAPCSFRLADQADLRDEAMVGAGEPQKWGRAASTVPSDSVPSWLCCGRGLRRYHRHYPLQDC